MCSVMAPPQKKLTGESDTLSLGWNGAVCGSCGESVWVKPMIPIIEIGGTQPFSPSSSGRTTGTGSRVSAKATRLDFSFPESSAGKGRAAVLAYSKATSDLSLGELGNGVVRYLPPPIV